MTRIFAGAAFALLLATAPAPAQAPAYVGTWGSDAAQCKLDQSEENAPMIVKANRYDQHETHCTFSSVRKRGSGWDVQARCQVDGDKQNPKFRIEVSGGKLTMDGRTLQRCK